MWLSNRFKKYYSTDRYRGFYKIRECKSKLSAATRLVFTNGSEKIFVKGIFKEDAMVKAFIAIDNYHIRQAQNKSTNLTLLTFDNEDASRLDHYDAERARSVVRLA